MGSFPVKKRAFYISLVVCIISLAFLFLFQHTEFQWYGNIFIVVLFSLIIYIFLNFSFKNFIEKNIEPIYKVIHEVPSHGEKNGEKIHNYEKDTTDVKKEVQEWANNKTQEISRLKNLEQYRKEFLGNVSHELKTPIFNIQGYILTLLDGGLEDPKINKLFLKRTEKSIDRMISIVQDLSSISKLESGEVKMRMENFDIVPLVKEVFELQSMTSHECEIKLLMEPVKKPIMVKADRKRIMEVITNLVTNALKYGKRKGYIKISFYDLKNRVMIEMKDNGIGISQDDLPRIFERFYRVDKSRSREQGGTGLGLSIVKHILEAHNQTINVKSVLDEGTTFTFTLGKAKLL
ncbi:MAG: sensor histidine kinase [Prolixibacteraceae bacterium]|nr:sensor histidine kinase [Prolixibacteraceae bacterium]